MNSSQYKKLIRNRQNELMLNYITKNPRMISLRLDDSFNKLDKETHWAILTTRLNEINPENKLPVEQWKKNWHRWKNNVKVKAGKYGERGLLPSEKQLLFLVKNTLKTNTLNEAAHRDVSFSAERKQDTERLDSTDSIYSDEEDNFYEMHEGRSGEYQGAVKGAEYNELEGNQSRMNQENYSKLVDEMRKLREVEENKIKVLQKMAEEEAKVPPALVQIGNTLQQMLAVQASIPGALHDIADKLDTGCSLRLRRQ